MITKILKKGDWFKIVGTDFKYKVIEIRQCGSVFAIDNFGDYNTFGPDYLNQAFLTDL